MIVLIFIHLQLQNISVGFILSQTTFNGMSKLWSQISTKKPNGEQIKYHQQQNVCYIPKTFKEIGFRQFVSDKKTTTNLKQTTKQRKASKSKQLMICKSNNQLLNSGTSHAIKRQYFPKQHKENLDFKSILIDRKQGNQKKRQTKVPSFLKNAKSFIDKKHQVNTQRSSQLNYQFQEVSQCNSITLSDRNSQDFNLGLNSRIVERSGKDYGLIASDRIIQSASNMVNSIELTQQLNDINSKIKAILNTSLNFGKRGNDYDNKMKDNQRLRATYSTSISVDNSQMIESIKSNLDKSYLQNPTVSSINFWKRQTKKVGKKVIKRQVRLSDFEVLQEIGSGKYGKVYLSKHKQTGFVCALKSVSKAIIKQENIQNPFIREIKIQMYLNHPNIVKLYGFFTDSDNVYLIMEYCSDGHLLKLIKQQTSFDQSHILQILTNIFQAVSYLHCHGIIHRDIKPQNIVISHGIYKLCDFGWATYARGDARTTFCGTPLYVSPQLLKGQQYNVKTDVWGLGIITYQLAYGRVPFPIWSQSDMKKIVNDPIYFPNWTNVSQKMQNLIKAMLMKNPEHRCSVNQVLNYGIIKQYLGYQNCIKSQVDSLF